MLLIGLVFKLFYLFFKIGFRLGEEIKGIVEDLSN